MIDRSEQLDGYTVNFVTFRQDIDATPLLKGRLLYRFGDHEESFEAGDAFYAPPGHVPVVHEPGTEMVQFSPTEELREVETVMARNMQAMLSA